MWDRRDGGRIGQPSGGLTDTFLASSWRAAVAHCVSALLEKPREFGMGSCDAWRGHFPENFRRSAEARAVSAVNSRGSARPSVQARSQ